MKKQAYISPAVQVANMDLVSLVCASIEAGEAQGTVTTEARGNRYAADDITDEEALYLMQEETPQNGLW
jgi:hypothetical protein